MMKKILTALLLVTSMMFSGCTLLGMADWIEEAKTDSDPPKENQENSIADEVKEEYGTYTVPEGWSEAKELSQKNLTFYLQNGTPTDKPTTNISVSEGKNKYSAADAGSFAQAIDRQLRSQAGSLDLKSYSGNGTFTEKDYPLITMVVETEEMTTIQHYIVGDHRYVMVHLSEYNDEAIPNAEEVALSIVNSFEWAD